MARYIDADKCNSYFFEHLDDQHMEIAMIAINEMPTEDVAPVTHAHWIYCESDDAWECSHCKMHSFQFVLFVRDGYCPACGAKMDEVHDG